MAEGICANTLRYRPELCTGCGQCGTVCPHGVFVTGERPARLLYPERCIECGACALNCPADAISVEAGVGCAYAMIKAALRGSAEISCGDNGC